MKIWTWLAWSVWACGLLPAVSVAQTTNAPKAGEIAPPFQLAKIIEGPALKDVSWQSLKGKVVVLEFWNIQCVPCIEAIPHLNEMVDHFKEKPVAFLLVSDDPEDRLRVFLKQHPIDTWLALDGPDNATERAFRLHGYGLVVVIDAEGKVAGVTLPAFLKTEHLNRVLAGQPAGLPVLNFAPAASAAPAVDSNGVSSAKSK